MLSVTPFHFPHLLNITWGSVCICFYFLVFESRSCCVSFRVSHTPGDPPAYHGVVGLQVCLLCLVLLKGFQHSRQFPNLVGSQLNVIRELLPQVSQSCIKSWNGIRTGENSAQVTVHPWKEKKLTNEKKPKKPQKTTQN